MAGNRIIDTQKVVVNIEILPFQRYFLGIGPRSLGQRISSWAVRTPVMPKTGEALGPPQTLKGD